jgi:hypothetical protein
MPSSPRLLRPQARVDDPGGSVADGIYIVCTRDACVPLLSSVEL